jgi:hypothetical protein
MNTRRKIAAWLHIAAAAFVATLVAGLWVCAALLAPTFEGTFVTELVAMFGRPIAVALLVFTVVEAAAAAALLRGQAWAAQVLMGVGLLQLPVFPIGTALSLFTLWSLLLHGG